MGKILTFPGPRFDIDLSEIYYGALMSDRLPRRIDPIRLAEQGRQLRGTLPVSEMQRLVPMLRSAAGEVDVLLQFDIDDQRVPYLHGQVTGEVEATCQRCLGPVRLPVDIDFSLGFVGSEAESGRLTERYEPLIVEPGGISVATIVEDELILSLPIIARHSEAESCRMAASLEAKPPLNEEAAPAGRVNPFSVLSKLKKE